jgi:hypothetical protein
MRSYNPGDTVIHIVSPNKYHTGTITDTFSNDMYEISYDSYGKRVIHEDNIYNDARRNVPLVSTYKDVDDDEMDMEMQLEMKMKMEEEEDTSDDEYEVEGIVDRRMIIIDGNEVVEFLIKWKDYAATKNTWERFDKLQQNDLVLADINEWMLIQQPIMMEDTSVDDQDWNFNVEQVLESWKKVLE